MKLTKIKLEYNKIIFQIEINLIILIKYFKK